LDFCITKLSREIHVFSRPSRAAPALRNAKTCPLGLINQLSRDFHMIPSRLSRAEPSPPCSRFCRCYPLDLPVSLPPRPSDLQTFSLPPGLLATSRPCCRLQALLLPPEPSTASRRYLYLQTLPLPPDVASTSRRCLYLQTLPLPPDLYQLARPGLATTSRPSLYLQNPPCLTGLPPPHAPIPQV